MAQENITFKKRI